jgi:hypothetical protein
MEPWVKYGAFSLSELIYSEKAPFSTRAQKLNEVLGKLRKTSENHRFSGL